MNIPKIDLKPASSEKITLFANKAEAIVFWLSLAGLIFLAIVSFSRYLGGKQSEMDKQFKLEIHTRLSTLEAENLSLKARLDSLQMEFNKISKRLAAK